MAELLAERLQDLAVIQVTGADARTYLQGQLTADMNALTHERVLMAACNSAQGRVQGILWMIDRADGLTAIVPDSMQARILDRLRKYVLRAKVTLQANESLAVGRALPETEITPSVGVHVEQAGVSQFTLAPSLHLVVAPASDMAEPSAHALRSRLDQIRAGIPQIYPETHEAFVAQMLNLDTLGAISFEKGCYTGQEIIARAHYRGTVKRRMFRFECDSTSPVPGTRVLSSGQHAGEVVDAAATANGCELLAVINLAQIDAPLEIESAPGQQLKRLPLPYEQEEKRNTKST
jgi:folate-binding protein YgfZ